MTEMTPCHPVIWSFGHLSLCFGISVIKICFLLGCHRAVIITVITVEVVKPPVDQKIHMVAVGDLQVSAAIVVASAFGRSTNVRVGFADGKGVLVYVVAVGVVEVAIVQIINVVFVLNANVAAIFGMNVGVIVVNSARHRKFLSFSWLVSNEWKPITRAGCAPRLV